MNGIFFNNFEQSYIPEILTEMYRQRVYAPFLHGKKDLTILDVGANIGLFSFYASQYAKRIYAIEPAQEHVDVANHMLKFNKLDEIVTVHRNAIAHENKEMTLHHNQNVTMFSLKEAVADKSLESETVEAVTLLKFLDDNKIEHVDFMKLDIEGAEMEVVSGTEFQEASKRIDSLVVEYHQWSGRNPAQLVTVLSDYGYEVKNIPADATLFGAVKRQ